ncbi:hypothetical protein BH11PSE2_BH11PSE2_10530 [soil metagenome]
MVGKDDSALDKEAGRLAALDRYKILDTAPEPEFDDIVRIAAQICDVPMALITLVDDRRQWFKSAIGVDASETPLEHGFCAQAIGHPGLLIINDATKDHRFSANPLVTDDPNLRFYAGAPLRTPDGFALGALCVLDSKTRHLDPTQQAALEALARQVMAQMELRRALMSNREAEQRHRLILESAVDYAIISMDLTGVVTSWNEGAHRIFGWAEDEMCGRRCDAFFTPEDRAAGVPDREMGAALTAGRGSDERWHLRKDGSRFWANGEMMPLTDDADRPVGFLKILRDRTQHILAEQAARASEVQFEQFTQAMPNQAWIALPDGNLTWFNSKVYDYSGLQQGDLAGSGWVTMVHPDDVPNAASRWSEARRSGELYEVQFRLRNAAGGYRWHIARALPVRADDGTVIRWIGTNTDIEDEKTTAEALAHLNETLEEQVAQRTADRNRMWRLSTDVMMVADFSAVVTAVNPAWTSALGWSEDELIGRSFLDMVHPDDRAATEAEVRSLSEGATTFKFESRFAHKDGRYRVLSWTAVPDDQFIHAVGRDVTAEREAAEALARTEEALRQSQKMDAVGQLTGGIAHDFNNMLAVIIGSLDLLKRRLGADDPRSKRYVEAAADGAQRAALLTKRLLAFSRLQPLMPESLDPNKLVAGMSDLLGHALGSDIRLETVLSGGVWRIHADPNQLENVILNLAVNARDAMPDGGRLTIETQNAHLDARYAKANGAAAGQYVLIAVSDTGVGMPAEVAAKAFEPFFTTKEVGKGTGLGLSQAYGFIKQSGGLVKIYSEAGIGTTIKVYLPRLTRPVDETNAEDVAMELALSDEQELILVVEDEPAVRQFSVDALSELGYRVIEAEGAAAALRLLDAHPDVALLFTDIVMPDVNGRKLADEARRRRPDLKILFTTGYTRNAIVHNGVLDPGVDLISKPFVLEELSAKIRDVLDGV